LNSRKAHHFLHAINTENRVLRCSPCSSTGRQKRKSPTLTQMAQYFLIIPDAVWQFHVIRNRLELKNFSS
jgi:hypothetical protein